MEIPAPPPSAQPADPAQASQATTQPAVASTGPNASPLDLFPQVLYPPSLPLVVCSFLFCIVLMLGLYNLQALPASANAGGEGNLDVLRNNAQFRSLLSLVQANPQILQVLFGMLFFPFVK